MIQILKPQMNLDNGEAFEVSETRILLSDVLAKKFFWVFLLGELRGVDKSWMRHRLKEGKSGRNHEGEWSLGQGSGLYRGMNLKTSTWRNF